MVPGARGPTIWFQVRELASENGNLTLVKRDGQHSLTLYPDMLSSRLLRPLRPARRPLLSRGASTPSVCLASPSRKQAFHASAPRQDAVIDAILYLPHEMMSYMHISLPWYATIPLTAFVFRGFLVTTAGAWTRSLTARYIGLQPLRQAIAFQKRDQVMRQGGFRSPKQASLTIKQAVKTETSKLDDKWKCTLWGQINWTIWQIPIFFTMAEVIRQMCNARDGLLAMALSSIGLKDSSAGTLHGVPLGPPNPWFEPSLAHEGMLWFPDLLAADPTGVLPYIVSGLMFTNVYLTKNTPNEHGTLPTASSLIRRTLLCVSLAIGPMCQQLPAALMLYWASSTSSVMLWNKWLDWKYPAPRGFTACKRPLQLLPPPKTRRA